MFKNHHPNILVVGDLMIDHYIWGQCDRISPEAPVQILNVLKESTFLGGAGNVIKNLKMFGAIVDVISVIGNDKVGNELAVLLNSFDVNSKMLVIEPNRKTSKKSRLIASQQQILRYDNESTKEINAESMSKVLLHIHANISNYDAVILSDYGKGVLSKSLTQDIISISNKNKIKVFVDPKGTDFSKYKGAFALTPNKKEAIEATNIDIHDSDTLEQAIKKLKEDCELEVSLITLSEKGIAIFDNILRIQPAVAREVFDVTGAGDTVIAAITFAITNNRSVDEAVKFANLAAGVVVGKVGSASATLFEIAEYESSLHKSDSFVHIKTIDEIAFISKINHSEGKKIVFTNGCFDLLHVGHIKYLEEAKRNGDVLIVGLNSDDSVKKLKGLSRPINTQEDRAYILASLEPVDFVVVFDEETPYNLIKIIHPDILVKGGDYKDKIVIGSDIVKKVILVEFINGKSTTKLIEKLKDS